jgi:hypothetical protein
MLAVLYLRLSCFGWRGGPEDRFIFAAIFSSELPNPHHYYNPELPVPFEFEVRYRRRCIAAPHFCKELPQK